MRRTAPPLPPSILRLCMSTALRRSGPGAGDRRLTFALPCTWHALKTDLCFVIAARGEQVMSSHGIFTQPPLAVFHHGEKAGLEALACPGPCCCPGSRQRPVLLPLPPGLRLRHLPAYPDYDIIESITEVFFFPPEL